jgi:hypothetical protein
MPRVCVGTLLLLALAACGGGGGSSAPPPAGQPPPGNSGNTAAASITSATVPTIADTTMSALVLASGVGAEVLRETSTNGNVDETVPGPTSGTVRIRGSIQNGRGSLTYTYSSYKDQDTVLNGTETVEILVQQTSGTLGLYNSQVRHSYAGFTVQDTATAESFSLTGSVTTAQTPDTNVPTRMNASMTGDLAISSTPDSRQARINTIALTRTYRSSLSTSESEWLLSGTARVYDSVTGYVDVNIESPLLFREIDPLSGPVYGGSAVLTGAGGTKLWVSPLTRDYVALELDNTGDGIPDRTLSYRWSEEFNRPASSRIGPVAISGPDLTVDATRSPGAFALEGRFSENSGGAFLSQEWSLVLAPQGSTAAISGATTSRAAILPDRNGTYLFRLRVSDGTNSTFDYLLLRATGYGGVTESVGIPPVLADDRRAVRIVVEPDLVAPVGTPVTFDGSRSHTADGSPLQLPRWLLSQVNDSSSVTLPDAMANTAQATTTNSRLTASFSAQRFQSDIPPTGSYLVVVPPTNRRMAPTVDMLTSTQDGSSIVGMADFNGDGIDDVLMVRSSNGGTSRLLRVLLGGRDGRLTQLGSELNVPEEFVPTVSFATAIGDLNGDARPDLVVADPVGIGYFLQTGVVGSPFGAYQTASSGSGCFSAARPKFSDVDGDGDLDVMANHQCSQNGMAVYFNTNGVLSPALPLTLTGTAQPLYGFVTIDLNLDNRADIVGADPGSNVSAWLATTTPGVYVPGPAIPTQFPAGGAFSQFTLVVADADGNGRSDIIASWSPLSILWQATDGTFSAGTLTTSNGLPGVGNVVAVRDFDGDGRKDILGSNGWFKNTNAASFLGWQPYSRGYANFAGDINGDGRPDLLEGSKVTLQAPPEGT